MSTDTSPLPDLLQQIRRSKRLSQLELALRMGVSQRHVSFVESGRANPSRDLLLAWLAELSAPLAVRNSALLKAGFAPVFSDASLDAPLLAQPNAALKQLLRTHDPMPAMVIGSRWELLQLNQGAKWLAGAIVPWAVDLLDSPNLNMLDLLIHPDGLTKSLVNLEEAGYAFLAQLRDEVSVYPELGPRAEAFAELLAKKTKEKTGRRTHVAPETAVLPLRFATTFGQLSFFRMFSTFGSPQDITLSSLRVEHMFASDVFTEQVLSAHVKQAI